MKNGNTNKTEEMEEDEEEVPKISIRLVLAPKQDPSLKVPADAIAVPSTLKRKGLSTLVNHMLGRRTVEDHASEEKKDDKLDKNEDDDSNDDEDDVLPPPIRFDFILNGKLLRMGIEAAVRRDGLSIEEAIEIQYFCAQEAPSSVGRSEVSPDWISALSFVPMIVKDGVVLSGSYDGTVEALDAGSCNTIASVKVHNSAVKCLDTVLSINGSNISNNNMAVVASGSMDQFLLTHTIAATEGDSQPKLALHKVYTGGHQNSIESVALLRKQDGKVLMASGDWDGQMCFWDDIMTQTDATIEGSSIQNKKVKTSKSKSKKSSLAGAPTMMPSSTIKAHAACISSIKWGCNESSSNTQLITSSWDHSAKVWDVEKQESILSLVGSRVISTMDRCSNSNIIATGHPDCTVRLWDMRVDVKQASSRVNENSLKPSHKAWVSALKWSPTQPFSLTTTSHDGTMKMWDIRTSLPIHSARAQEKIDNASSLPNKGLSLCYASHGRSLYVGGTDCRVKKFNL